MREDDFRALNIEDCLPGIRAPIFAIQGGDDEYGTMAQIEATAAGAHNSVGVELLKPADCRHSADKDQTATVIEAINRFAESLDVAPWLLPLGGSASPCRDSPRRRKPILKSPRARGNAKATFRVRCLRRPGDSRPESRPSAFR